LSASLGYKPTEIGQIPNDWELVRLENIASSYRNGIYKRPQYYGRGLPSVRMYNIADGKINTLGAPLLEVTKEELEQYGLVPGDIVVNRVNTVELVGKAGIVPEELGPVTFESKNIRVRVLRDRCSPDFLAYFMNTDIWHREIRSGIKPAVAQATVNQEDLDNLLVPLPSLMEQQKIASILATIDDTIQMADKVIERTQRLKKSLMRQLLTKGIGHVRFKETEIGKVPIDWEISSFGKECEIRGGGTPSRTNPDYFKGNIPWVKSTELDYDIIYFTEEKITETAVAESNAKIFPKGSLLVAMIGLEAAGTRGRCAILGIDAAFNQSCAGLKSLGRIHIPFLFYYYQLLRGKILSFAAGTKRQNLNLSLVGSLAVPVPPISEQIKIAEILSEVDSRIKLEGNRRGQLARLKRGLLGVLFTGKVRVKVS